MENREKEKHKALLLKSGEGLCAYSAKPYLTLILSSFSSIGSAPNQQENECADGANEVDGNAGEVVARNKIITLFRCAICGGDGQAVKIDQWRNGELLFHR